MIDITPLKEEVRARKRVGDSLREAVLSEADRLAPTVFLAKIRPWLVMMRFRGNDDGERG